jgi:hypothetical protein
MRILNQMNALGCIFYWEKMDVIPNNPPECEALYNQSKALIEDLDSYYLYRTVYDDGEGIPKSQRTSMKKKF